MSSQIANLAVDDPVELTADYQLDEEDRRYVDDQARGAQVHLVDLLIAGTVGSWYELDSGSADLVAGDVFCQAGDIGGRKVEKALASPLSAAGRALGLALTNAAAGTRFQGALLGAVRKAVTGLALGLPGHVRVNTTTARPERLAGDFASGDYPLGYVDALGVLTLGVENQIGTVGPELVVTTISTDTNLGAAHRVVLLDGGSNTVTATLPAAAGNTGREYNCKCVDATFACDVDVSGGGTIDGAATQPLALHEAIHVVSDGTEWWIL